MDREATEGRGLITSPRSLFACELEGVDPAADLVMLSRADAMRTARGDVAAAERRLQWWRSRRDALLEDLIAARRAIIAAERASPPAAPATSSLKSAKYTVGATAQSSSPTPTPTAGAPDADDAEEGSVGDGQKSIGRRAAAANKTSVDKVRAVIEANAARERRQMAYLATSRDEHSRIEAAREADAERREEQRRVAAAVARKRDLDIRDRLARQEARRVAADTALLTLQLERAEALEAEAEAREDRLAERRAAMEEERRERQREQRAKQEHFTEQAAEQRRERLAAGLARQAAEGRRLAAMREARDGALAKRRANYEDHTAALRQKKAMTDLREEERMLALEAALREEDAAMLRRQQELSTARLHEKVVRSVKDKERREAFARAQAIAAERAAEVEQQIANDDERMALWRDRREGDLSVRRLNKAFEEEERSFGVARVRRRNSHERRMAERRADEKAARIEALRAEQRRLTEERRRAQEDVERAKASLSLPSTAKSPGPQDYDVFVSEAALLPNAPVTHIGTSRRQRAVIALSPGPGHYSLPPVRKSKGAVLPPWRGTPSPTRSAPSPNGFSTI